MQAFYRYHQHVHALTQIIGHFSILPPLPLFFTLSKTAVFYGMFFNWNKIPSG